VLNHCPSAAKQAVCTVDTNATNLFTELSFKVVLRSAATDQVRKSDMSYKTK